MQRRSLKKEIVEIAAAVFIMSVIGIITVCFEHVFTDKSTDKKASSGKLTSSTAKEEVLNVWYYDDSMTAYLKNISAEYEKKYDVKVKYKKQLKENYLEHINASNIDGKNIPDAYIMDSTFMEKAVLSGMALENRDSKKYNDDNFSKTAISAITYKNRMYAYPVNFNSCVLAYNKAYVTMPPKTFDDIIDYSNNLSDDLSGKIENILLWDVKDLIYNYGFAGAYINYGGDNGDDISSRSFNNENVVKAMEYYRNLNQIFYIDINTASSEDVITRFSQGKAAYSIISQEAVKKLDEMDNKLDYGITVLPDLNGDLKTKGLALTNVFVVNPYASDTDEAEKFIKYMTFDKASESYKLTGWMSPKKNIDYKDVRMDVILAQYSKSVNLPKLMKTGEFGAKMESVLNQIWQGGDIGGLLSSLE